MARHMAGGSKQDFSGFDGEDRFGRMHLDQTASGKDGWWRWNVGFEPWVRKRIMPQQGWERTPREPSYLGPVISRKDEASSKTP